MDRLVNIYSQYTPIMETGDGDQYILAPLDPDDLKAKPEYVVVVDAESGILYEAPVVLENLLLKGHWDDTAAKIDDVLERVERLVS